MENKVFIWQLVVFSKKKINESLTIAQAWENLCDLLFFLFSYQMSSRWMPTLKVGILSGCTLLDGPSSIGHAPSRHLTYWPLRLLGISPNGYSSIRYSPTRHVTYRHFTMWAFAYCAFHLLPCLISCNHRILDSISSHQR